MSQLGLGLGLTRGGGVPFNPLSLNPYLLFDTRSSMIGTFENPTLDLDPSDPDTLDVITATRSGVATYTDADGLIQSASADTVRVDHVQGEELTPTKFQHVVQTDYSASPNGIGSRVTLSDISGPDGESGGVRITETADTTQHYLSVIAREIVAGTTYTFSFYIKEGTYSSVGFYTQSAKVTSNVIMNFSTGTASFGGADLVSNSGSFTSVGDGWYRVVYSATANGSGEMDLYVTIKDLSSYAGDVNNFIDYYGFQVEEGTTASDFVANTTGSLKFITGATYGPRVPMILVEPSATNLVEYSEDGTQWGKANATITSNTTEAPDGTQTADTVVRTVFGGGGDVREFNKSVTSGLDYSLSIFAKAETDALIKLDVSNSVFGSADATFNVRTGEQTAGDTTKTSVEVLSNGWRRFVYTPTCLTTGTSNIIIRLENDEPVHLWGFQFEEGSVATSYIPTSGSTVTRQADDLVISGSDFTDFYNGSEGTFYVETTPSTDENIPHIFEAYDSAVSNKRITLFINSNSNVGYYMQNGGTQSSTALGLVDLGENNRVAYSYKTNDLLGSLNGGAEVPDTSASIPTSINTLILGNLNNRLYPLTGRLKRLIYWPYHSDSL